MRFIRAGAYAAAAVKFQAGDHEPFTDAAISRATS